MKTKPKQNLSSNLQPAYKWAMALIMISVLALGYNFPLLGFAVPIVMLTGISISFSRGRYSCGNICPRGSFYDTFFSYLGGRREIPGLFRSRHFRWTILILLMSFMTWRISQNPSDWRHWGTVFWSMCAITTAVGVPLGMIYSARSWCSFCPVGTISAAIGGQIYPLQIATGCRQCGLCEKACPMGLTIAEHRQNGCMANQDCLKCSLCISSCPTGQLGWQSNKP